MEDREQIERRVKRVRAAMEHGLLNDPRFSRLVHSCVAMAREEYGRADPDHADRAVYEHATFAAAMVLARVYDEDGDLAAMRAERDRYRRLAEDVIHLFPKPMFIATPAAPLPGSETSPPTTAAC